MSKFNNNQLKQLADFISNLGLVFVAVSITPLFSGVDRVNIFTIILGMTAALASLVGSMSLLKKS